MVAANSANMPEATIGPACGDCPMNRHRGGCWTSADVTGADENPPVSVPSTPFLPEPGDVIWAGHGGNAVRLLVHVVDLRPLYAGWLWLLGAELDAHFQPIGVIDVLAEPECLWLVRRG